MSTNVGAIPPAVPATDVTTADAEPVSPPDRPEARSTAAAKQENDAEGIAPVPIQPLSNRVLATFMQKDIELYGSTFGA